MLYIHEIFRSIQGEGYDTGIPCTFVRLFGCNLQCVYCDQPQDKLDRKRISVENVIDAVRKLRCRNVCITGGEPLMQEEVIPLIYELSILGYNVSVETNGAVAIDEDNHSRKFKYVMDVKCPSSNMDHKNIYSNLKNLHGIDEVKFVIADRVDYDFAKDILKKYPTKAKVLFSPMFDYNKQQTIGGQLVEWILADNLDVKIQIQLHKILSVM